MTEKLMSEDRYLNYGKLITDYHTKEELITCKSNKNAEQITNLLNMYHRKVGRTLRKWEREEETCLRIMSYLHDNYYNIWEEVNKECFLE